MNLCQWDTVEEQLRIREPLEKLYIQTPPDPENQNQQTLVSEKFSPLVG